MNRFWAVCCAAEYGPHFGVRECAVDERGRVRFVSATLFASLEDAHEWLLERGLVPLPRRAGDDPNIVETWI